MIVDGVGLTHGAVGGKFDGAALHECARRHDNVGVVAGHRRGHGVNVAVHRGGSLNALAEGDHALGRAELNALDDVVARLLGGGDDGEAELFIARGDEHRALDRAGDDAGGEEEALIQRRHETKVCADLLPKSRRGEAVGAAVDALLRAADVAADGSKTAAGVLDETADDHIRAEVARLVRLDKFAVAVVDHDDNIRAQLLAEGNGFADGIDGDRRARAVALGALDVDELRLIVQRALDGGEVKAAVFAQVDLRIADAVLLERARAFADADDLLKRVVGLAGDGKQLIARQKVRGKRDGQRVRAAGDLRADERGLGVEGACVHAL